jgi:hypothetical protein
VLKGDDLTTFIVPKVEKIWSNSHFDVRHALRYVAEKVSLSHLRTNSYLLHPRDPTCAEFMGGGGGKETPFRRTTRQIESQVNVLQKHLLLIRQQVNWFWKHYTKPMSANTPFHLVGQITFYKKQDPICWARELFPQFQFLRCTYLGALVRSLLCITNFYTTSLILRQTVITLL